MPTDDLDDDLLDRYVASALAATGTQRAPRPLRAADGPRGTVPPPVVGVEAPGVHVVAAHDFAESTMPDSLANLFAVETDDEVTAVFERP